MSEFRIVRDYPAPVPTVWRAVTDPDLVPRWTSTGQGARPVGFAPVEGTRFQFVAKPVPGWRGIVDCEVVEVAEPSLLRFTWVGDEGDRPSLVTYRLEPIGDQPAAGTRFTYEHTGLTGVGGFVMARLLKRIRTRMLTEGLPPLLDDLVREGRPRP
jgi:uncharacterized protein YndB with AHSA1/START domain